jgi:HAD superfamily hydrolase (TIGR01459 family)
MNDIQILSGLSDIAGDYDALICDVWGVLHNGNKAFAPACAALKAFKDRHGPVILLTNAPRPVKDVEELFVEKYGIPLDCYDAIVTSGAAARNDLAERSKSHRLAILHIGRDMDQSIFEGLNVETVDVDNAGIVLCSGLNDDETETPADYVALLAKIKARGLVMLCANPDIVVQRGGQLVYCAGALAREYQKIGGEVVYFGKPYPPIYDLTRDTLRKTSGRTLTRLLAVGDGLPTDIKGANAVGMDALFIAHGIHAVELGEMTPDTLAQLFDSAGVRARAAMRELVW